MLNMHDVYQGVDRHVVVDMARLTARARATVLAEEEKWLFASKFELRSSSGSLKASMMSVDSNKIEDPDTLFAKAITT
jgi:hypothetical protein